MPPSENHRSFIYATAIASTARPMVREDFECPDCGLEYFACECSALPPYAGADPALYHRENSNER